MKLSNKVFCTLLSLGIIANSFIPIYAKQEESFIPKISVVDNVDNPAFISGMLTEESNLAPQNIVRKYYNNVLKYTQKDGNPNSDFKILDDFKNSKEKNVIQTVQMYKNVPVYGTEKNFHISDKGVIQCITGSSVDDIENRVIASQNSVKVNPSTVLKVIENDLGFEPKYSTPPKHETILYPIGENYVYAYKVNIEIDGDYFIDADYIVNASNLSIVEVLSNVASYEQPITGSGIGQSGTVKQDLQIVADYSNNIFYLKSAQEKVETGLRYIENSQIICPIITESDSFFNSGTTDNYQTHGVDAHNNLTKVSNFFRSSPFNRNGNDDLGSTLVARILKHDPFRVNAYATTNEISYCVGLASGGKGTAVALDIAAHEYTHGILFSEGLTYTTTCSEYGAIHEGVADTFAAVAEYFIPHEGVADWTAGEDTGDVMRDCANPQIDDYSDYIQNQPRPHLGGGVITKAASLIAMGGTHNNQSVASQGYGKLANIFYDAINDGYIVENMSFMQFAGAAIHSATLLYGSSSLEAKAVKDAFVAVGVMTASPTNLRVLARSGLTVKLAWNSISGARYGIYRRSNGISGPIGQPVKIAQTTNTSLSVQTLYGICDFYIAIVDTAGNRISAFSNVKTVEAYAGSAPTNFRLNSKNGLSASLSWNGTSAGRYSIFRKVTGTTGEPVKLAQTTSTTLTVDTLQGSCDFYVAAINSQGIRTSAFSNLVVVGSFISAPSSFWSSGCNGLNANIAWWSGSTGVRYAVYRKVYGASGEPVKLMEITNTSNNTNVTVATLPGLCNFYLAIVDTAGNRISEYSYPVTVYAY